MKRFGLLVIVIVSLFAIGCTPTKKKPSGGHTETGHTETGGESSCCSKPDDPTCCADKAKEGEAATATGESATEEGTSATEGAAPEAGDTPAEPAGDAGPPPTEPDPAGLMDLDVDPTGPALGAPENKPDTSP